MEERREFLKTLAGGVVESCGFHPGIGGEKGGQDHFAERHGFPLRTVAEDYYGYDWVKYVYKITVDKIE